MVKQYKAQVKVTELWLDDLGKHNEENASLNQVSRLQHSLNKYYNIAESFRTEVAQTNRVNKVCKQGIRPGFESQGRYRHKSKTGVAVIPQKGIVSSKNLKIKLESFA